MENLIEKRALVILPCLIFMIDQLTYVSKGNWFWCEYIGQKKLQSYEISESCKFDALER